MAKNRKPNPIHDVTGCCRWPQQEEKLRRQRQKPEQQVKFVDDWNSRDGFITNPPAETKPEEPKSEK
jgi:hypothetical protein